MENSGPSKESEDESPNDTTNQSNTSSGIPNLTAQIPALIRPVVPMRPVQPILNNYPHRQPLFPTVNQNAGQQRQFRVLHELGAAQGRLPPSFPPQHGCYPVSCHNNNCKRCQTVLARRHLENQRPFVPLTNRNTSYQQIPVIGAHIRTQRIFVRQAQAPYPRTMGRNMARHMPRNMGSYVNRYNLNAIQTIQAPNRPVRCDPPVNNIAVNNVQVNNPNSGLLGLLIFHLLFAIIVAQQLRQN